MSTTSVPVLVPSTVDGVSPLRLLEKTYAMSFSERKVQTKPRLFGCCIFSDVSSACTTSAAATSASSRFDSGASCSAAW
jgi:hypothetical protein